MFLTPSLYRSRVDGVPTFHRSRFGITGPLYAWTEHDA